MLTDLCKWKKCLIFQVSWALTAVPTLVTFTHSHTNYCLSCCLLIRSAEHSHSHSHTDGYTFRGKFGVQYLAQGHSDSEIRVQTTDSSDWRMTTPHPETLYVGQLIRVVLDRKRKAVHTLLHVLNPGVYLLVQIKAAQKYSFKYACAQYLTVFASFA